MQKIKKLLCLIICVAIVTPTICFATEVVTTETTQDAAVNAVYETDLEPGQFTDVDYETVQGKAIETLVEENIITGFPDGTFKSEKSLTRAEFAKIIVCFLKAEVSINYDSGFSDVDKVGEGSHWAKQYIKIAKDMNIISGFPDGTFRPDDQVTYEQATKMIMSAKGYVDLPYPEGYIQAARQKRLYTNTTFTGSYTTPIDRGFTAIVIYNALSIPEFSTGGSNSGSISIGGGGSITIGGGGSGSGGGGSSDSSTKKIYGTVWGTSTTMLDTTISALDDDEIDLFTDGEHKAYRISSSISPSKYLGRYVRAYVKEDDDGEEYISKFESLSNYNTVKNISLYDFIDLEYDEEKETYIFNYYDGEDKEDLAFDSEEVHIIYNGRSINVDEAENYEFDPSFISDLKVGSFSLLSNDKDKKIDVVFLESYKTAVVGQKITSSSTLKFKYDAGELDVSDRNRTVIIRKDNRTATFSDIKADCVIDYKYTLDNKVLEIDICDKTMSGTIKSVEDDYIMLTNDRTKYTYNYNYAEYLNNYEDEDKYIPAKDDRVNIYFNSDGNIAEIVRVKSSTNEKFGYILAMGFEKGGNAPQDEEDTPMLRIYTAGASKGVVDKLNIASSVRIDGKMYKNNPEGVMEAIEDAAIAANEGKSSDLNTNTTYASFIRYELEGGYITLIDTILDAEGNVATESDERYNTLVRSTYIYSDEEALDGMHKYHSTNPYGFYKTSSSTKFKVYNNSSDTTIVFIPGNRANDKNYSSDKFKTANFKNGMKYYVEAYNLNDKNYAQFVLQYISNGNNEITAYSTVGVVTRTETSAETGTNKIYYRSYGNNTEQSKQVGKKSPALSKFAYLNVGDVILFSTDLDGNVYDYYYALDMYNLPIKRVDDYDLFFCTDEINDRRVKGFDLYPDDTQNNGIGARYRTVYGTATNYEAGTLYVNPALATDYLEPSDTHNYEYDIHSSTRLFVYDESTEELVAYNNTAEIKNYLKDELITAETNNGFDGADQVFVYTYGGASSSSSHTLRIVYIIKNSDQHDPGNYEGVETPEDAE